MPLLDVIQSLTDQLTVRSIHRSINWYVSLLID